MSTTWMFGTLNLINLHAIFFRLEYPLFELADLITKFGYQFGRVLHVNLGWAFDFIYIDRSLDMLGLLTKV